MDETNLLTESEYNEMSALFVQEFILPLESQTEPVAILIGGQWGSGRSNLMNLSKQDFNDFSSVLVINEDELRRIHSKRFQAISVDQEDMSSFIEQNINQWKQDLITKAIQQKVNVVIEDTLTENDISFQMIPSLIDAGYRVIIRIMAVNESVSLLGIRERYEYQLEISGFGQSVNRKKHDLSYVGLIKSLHRIESECLFHEIELFNRHFKKIYHNKCSNHQLFNEPRGVMVLVHERDRLWTLEETIQYINSFDKVLKKMDNRGADPYEVIHVYRLQKERISKELLRLKGGSAKLLREVN
ncbi:Zeta toxin [Seinonella peptonophila]|uniref:UDP-N-acetylglucosamine kinase n=1 Tax=Seinonella peptonophila TaxID=112248 RepID=A0A1M4T0P9_9BACL|nr:zeta toxin family protein [Seinonella peptonophila]SHE38024.1 Zeta toxin [Seinonella peptonophila]